MRHHLLRGAAIGLALLAGTTFAAAQSQQDQDKERAKQAAPAEPSAAAPTPAAQPVFVDGKLAVPGAPTDSQTVPAKFSARNDALDKLDFIALAAQRISDAQRQTLYQRLGSARETTGASATSPGDIEIARVGLMLPASVELQALPGDVIRQMPDIATYEYARIANKVVLVEPYNRVVMAVLGS